MAGPQPPADPSSPAWGAKSFASLFASSPTTSDSSPLLKIVQNYKGDPAFFFSESEIADLSKPFHHALVGKFGYGKPSMEVLRKEFHTIGLKGSFTIGWLDVRHVLIRVDREEDYVRLWLKGSWTINGFQMRVFKWHPDFRLNIEPSIVPTWISFPGLPIHLFRKDILFSLSTAIGIPLKIDEATANLSRPSVARVCVELDLLKSHPKRLWIGFCSNGFYQRVEYSDLPSYCSSCRKIGHEAVHCRHHPEKPIVASAPMPHLPFAAPTISPLPPAVNNTKATSQPPPTLSNGKGKQQWVQKHSDPSNSSQHTLDPTNNQSLARPLVAIIPSKNLIPLAADTHDAVLESSQPTPPCAPCSDLSPHLSLKVSVGPHVSLLSSDSLTKLATSETPLQPPSPITPASTSKIPPEAAVKEASHASLPRDSRSELPTHHFLNASLGSHASPHADDPLMKHYPLSQVNSSAPIFTSCTASPNIHVAATKESLPCKASLPVEINLPKQPSSSIDMPLITGTGHFISQCASDDFSISYFSRPSDDFDVDDCDRKSDSAIVLDKSLAARSLGVVELCSLIRFSKRHLRPPNTASVSRPLVLTREARRACSVAFNRFVRL